MSEETTQTTEAKETQASVNNEVEGSSMVKAIREMRLQSTEKQSETQSKPTEEPKKTEIENPKKEPESKKDEEPTIEELSRRDGKPISQAARESFKKLETANKANKIRIEELEKELEKFKAGPSADDITSHESYLTLAKQKQELEDRISLIDFENGEEFKSTFIEPRKKAGDDVMKYITDLSERDFENIAPLLGEMDSLNGDPKNETKFLKIVDKISESMTPSVAARFAKASMSFFEASVAERKAYADKAAARSEIYKKREETTSKGLKGIENALRAKVMAWEKTPVGKVLLVDKDKDFASRDTITTNMKKAVTALNDFIAGGVITPELQDILVFGAIGDVHTKERDFLLTGFRAISEENESIKKELESTKAKLDKLSAKPSGSFNDDDSQSTEKPSGYGMLDAIRSAKKNIEKR